MKNPKKQESKRRKERNKLELIDEIKVEQFSIFTN